MYQRVAAMPKLVDFPLLAAVEDYCDSPRIDFLSASGSLSASGLIKRQSGILPRV